MRVIAGLFSILMPGFGQFYNKQNIKGFAFLVIEHYDNVLGHINKAIELDFLGYRAEAVAVTDFQYMLFYPGFYVYCVWDAWYFAKSGADKTKTAIPFLIGGFIGVLISIFGSIIPHPAITAGFSMIVPMLFGMFIFRKQ